jgi:hypothetical protein
MEKRTIISSGILLVVICVLLGLSIVNPALWAGSLSHWIMPASIAMVMTLLVGLILMDRIFELDKSLVITLKRSHLKIEIKKYLVWAFILVSAVSIILEVVQFFLSGSSLRWMDPLMVLSGSALGIVIHIIGSKRLMKRVEFELEKWEDNVL